VNARFETVMEKLLDHALGGLCSAVGGIGMGIATSATHGEIGIMVIGFLILWRLP
jgi:hypothetical protein